MTVESTGAYEDDEPVESIRAAFDAAEKGVTRRPAADATPTVDGRPLAEWREFWRGGDVPPRGRAGVHADYPHHPGYLMGCPACEARCHCTAGSAECVFGGYHIEWCRTCEEETLDDGEGWDGECGNCADRTYRRDVDEGRVSDGFQ